MEFEWDERKSERNRVARGLPFEEAAEAFIDPLCVTIIDDREAYGEERLTTFGMIDNRLFAVTHTMRDEVIRIISARKATKQERKRYENENI